MPEKEKIIDRYTLSPELTLMLSLALQAPAPAIPENLDPAKFETLVLKNRIEPLVADGIKRLPAEIVQQHAILQKLAEKQKSYTLLCMRQMQTLAGIVGVFAEKGIRVLSLKGPILAAELYGDPTRRFSRDLDLLVQEPDLAAASACLEALGYTEEITVFNKTPLRRRKLEKNGEEMHRVYTKDAICIELHWRLSFRLALAFDDLWERSRTKVLLGQAIHYLGECDNIAYLITHGAGHGYHRLRWLIDIYQWQKQTTSSWAEVYDYMAKQQVGMLLLETLLLLYTLSPFPMLPYESERFSLRRAEDKVILRYPEALQPVVQRAVTLTRAAYPMLSNDTDENGMAGRRYDRLLPTLGRKKTWLRSFAALWEPGRAELTWLDLPDPLYFLYYIIRPFYKLWRMTPFSRKP